MSFKEESESHYENITKLGTKHQQEISRLEKLLEDSTDMYASLQVALNNMSRIHGHWLSSVIFVIKLKSPRNRMCFCK